MTSSRYLKPLLAVSGLTVALIGPAAQAADQPPARGGVPIYVTCIGDVYADGVVRLVGSTESYPVSCDARGPAPYDIGVVHVPSAGVVRTMVPYHQNEPGYEYEAVVGCGDAGVLAPATYGQAYLLGGAAIGIYIYDSTNTINLCGDDAFLSVAGVQPYIPGVRGDIPVG